MSVKMAILLNKLGLYVTHDGDRHKVIVKKDIKKVDKK
jgi:hypothetical protein